MHVKSSFFAIGLSLGAASFVQAASVTLQGQLTITGTNVSNLVANNGTALSPLIGSGIGDTIAFDLTIDEDAVIFSNTQDTTVPDGRLQAFLNGVSGSLQLSAYAFDLFNPNVIIVDDQAFSSAPGRVFDSVTIDSRPVLASGESFAPITTSVTTTLGDVITNTWTSLGFTGFRLSGNDTGQSNTGDLFSAPDLIDGVAGLADVPANRTGQIDLRLQQDSGGFLDLSIFGTVDLTATVTRDDPPVVPLPASLPLMLVVLGGFAALRARQRA